MIASTGRRTQRSRHGGTFRSWLFFLLVFLAVTGWAQDSVETRGYEQPRQPLQQALARLAADSGLQILMAPQMLRDKVAPALSGRYSVAQALQQLLAGSGLSYRLTGSGVITIVEVKPSPPAVVPAPARARVMPVVESSLPSLQVTGSRIRRSEFEGAAPVTVITAEQMQRDGYMTLSEALGSNGMNDYGAESQAALGRFSANAQPLNLRGLGPGRVLILVDGRRVPDYPFPSNGRSNFQSIGSIPLGSVDRVELMTGGASAIYGADAIGGVINILLKRPRSGSQVKLRTGTSTQGGADRVDLQWSGGYGTDTLGLSYGLQYSHRELLQGSQRDLQRPRVGTAPAQPELGLGLLRRDAKSGALLPLPADVCQRWSGEFVDWDYSSASSVAGMQGAGCGTWRNAGYPSLADGVQELAGQLQAEWSLSSVTQAWAALQAWQARSELAPGLETITGPHSRTTGRVNEIYDPQLGYIAPRRLLTPQEVGGLGAANDHYRERMWDLALGLRGQYGEHLDWSLTAGRSDYLVQRDQRRLLGDQVNAFFFGVPLGMTDDGITIQPLDLQHWYRLITPQEYAAMSGIVHYDAQTRVDSASYVVTGSLFYLPAGPLGMAMVLEASRQRYQLQNTPSLLPLRMEAYNMTGSVGGGRRDRYAAGAELSIPLSSTLKLSLAGRFDDYDDVTELDVARTWNAGLEWRPTSRLLLRASHATSFKAPDMHWVFTDGGGSFGSAVDVTRCMDARANPLCDGYVTEFLTWTYRNPELDAETGSSTTAGLVWDAGEALSMSVDYWDIRNKGGIGRISPAQLLRDEAECLTGRHLDGSLAEVDLQGWQCRMARSRVRRSDATGTGRILMVESMAANQSEQRIRGVDAVLDWRGITRFGGFNLHTAWSHTFWGERRVRAPGTLHDQWRDAQWTSGENLAFRSNLRTSLGWQGSDGWSANLAGTRYGRLARVDGQGWIDPLWLWNANLGKRVSERATVTLFISNLFDSAPPRDSSNDEFPYYYDEVYSAMGRQLAVQLDYNFD